MKTPDEVEEKEDVREEAANRIAGRAAQKYKGKVTNDIQVGDHVRFKLVRGPLEKPSKTGYWRKEVYKVVAVRQNRKHPNIANAYRIEDATTGEKVQGFVPRGDLLKIPKDFVKIPDRVVRPGPVNADASDEEPKYEVESILDKKIVKATRRKPETIMYKVKWKGWKKPTWEAAENLEHAQDANAEFESA
ncbi:hypothetical protein HK097_007369 [Rhizophlyctis rosea]|uniref:Chromo domain-containing protein n=1 Tax=Rhizophlyctis rosea TaxID=64517 RepID=A0AAD5SBT6_9FUNG|nr:hypothetical protein HK097_007369 [Rhizophlyctis rosea]